MRASFEKEKRIMPVTSQNPPGTPAGTGIDQVFSLKLRTILKTDVLSQQTERGLTSSIGASITCMLAPSGEQLHASVFCYFCQRQLGSKREHVHREKPIFLLLCYKNVS